MMNWRRGLLLAGIHMAVAVSLILTLSGFSKLPSDMTNRITNIFLFGNPLHTHQGRSRLAAPLLFEPVSA